MATGLGVFGATLVTFFLAEMGDKTQIATFAMAAHFPSTLLVVAGTTLGMLIADVPAVFLGDRLAKSISLPLVHAIAAGIFALLGIATLFGPGRKARPVTALRAPRAPRLPDDAAASSAVDRQCRTRRRAAAAFRAAPACPRLSPAG